MAGSAMSRDAAISACGRYRYWLSRSWDAKPALAFIMLNPSTADAAIDDPTIRRCMGFAQREGYGGICVVNLFAWRSTDKSALLALPYDLAVGDENDDHIGLMIAKTGLIVAAWGGYSGKLGKLVAQRVTQVKAICGQAQKPLFCLGVSKGGMPRHPLYLPKDTQLSVWSGV